MTSDEKVAYINAQVACALIEAEGMKAENAQRAHLEQSMAYPEVAFTDLINKYGIYHNAVLTLFHGE